MKSKICGVADTQTAKRVLALRPDAIGLYCWTDPQKGRNFTDKQTARGIARLAAQASVDSFYLMYEDEPITAEQAYADCAFIGNTHLQIVGDMALGEIVKLKQRLPLLQIVKRVGVVGPESVREAQSLAACAAVDQLLLDSSSGAIARGGTGKTHDWDVSRQIVDICPKPVWLAGGLRPTNVEAAMQGVHPYGIDVETGVQLPDGSKDYSAMETLINLARAFEA